MDRTFALEILPILGIVLIVLVLLLREVASGTFFSSLGNMRTPLCKISSTGEIEQRFRLN